MPYKPVGIDENSRFPPRVNVALADMFVTKPSNISDGQVPVWDAASQKWIAGAGGSGGGRYLPSAIDGGSIDPISNDWHPSGWTGPDDTQPDTEPDRDLDGGTPLSN